MELTTKQKLLEACDGDQTLAEQMAVLLCKSIPKRLEALKNARNNNDFTSMSKEAHGLKSATCYLGETRLRQICSQIEKEIKNNTTHQIHEMLLLLENECASTVKALS